MELEEYKQYVKSRLTEEQQTVLNDALAQSSKKKNLTKKSSGSSIPSPMAKRYENAFSLILNGLPLWKRVEVDKDLKSGKLESRLVKDFVQRVVATAESDSAKD